MTILIENQRDKYFRSSKILYMNIDISAVLLKLRFHLTENQKSNVRECPEWWLFCVGCQQSSSRSYCYRLDAITKKKSISSADCFVSRKFSIIISIHSDSRPAMQSTSGAPARLSLAENSTP